MATEAITIQVDREAARAYKAAAPRDQRKMEALLSLWLKDVAMGEPAALIQMMTDLSQKARDRGLDVDHLQETYVTCINKALEAKPADMIITTHVCRGNFRSTFISSGGYEPVAQSLLAKCNYDGYFLEYDTDRAGGFEPLHFLPKGSKIVVLGLVTSKQGRLEPRTDIKKRIQEATKFVALDQLCLSPQCGFASTEEGNVLAEDEQWAKLRMIVELAEEVWGK